MNRKLKRFHDDNMVVVFVFNFAICIIHTHNPICTYLGYVKRTHAAYLNTACNRCVIHVNVPLASVSWLGLLGGTSILTDHLKQVHYKSIYF